MSEIPKCKACGKPVKDYKKLKHTVEWEGNYYHTHCFMPVWNEYLNKSFQPLHNIIGMMKK
jgi:hypothetical protein